MKTYFVYILRCADLSYYTGVTNNLEARLIQHESGYASCCYTASRLPVKLVFSQQFDDIIQAIALEKQIKGWSRKKKEAFIAENWDELKKLAKSSLKKSMSGKPEQREDLQPPSTGSG